MSPELRRRIAFSLGALLVYRLGTSIPIPGIDPTVLQQLFRSQPSGILGMANLFSGDAFQRLSIFALGIGPYVTAAIIVRLFLLLFPKAAKRDGERGRRSALRLTLLIAVLLTAFQSLGVASGLANIGGLVDAPGPMFRVSTVVSLTGGTLFLVWLCELITLSGVGNGLGLLLFAGVATHIPSALNSMFQLTHNGYLNDKQTLGLGALAIAIVAATVVAELARRRVPVEFTGRQVGDRVIAAQLSALSIKLNNAGVIPIVVASWLLEIVTLIAFAAGRFDDAWVRTVAQNFGPSTPAFMIVTAVAIVLLTFLYTAFVLDPEAAAQRLQAYGGVIPGIAPGEATVAHIDSVVSRTTVLGAAYLAAIVAIPELVIAYTGAPFYFGGVSALVVVCVVLDISAQVRADGLVNTGG